MSLEGTATAHLVSVAPEWWGVGQDPGRLYRCRNRLYSHASDYPGLCYQLPVEPGAMAAWLLETRPGVEVAVTQVRHEESGVVMGQHLEVGDVIALGPGLTAEVTSIDSLLDESASVILEGVIFPLIVNVYEPVVTMRERVVDWGPSDFTKEEAEALVGRHYVSEPHWDPSRVVGRISEVTGPDRDGACRVVLKRETPTPPFISENLDRWALFAVQTEGPKKGERFYAPMDGPDGGPAG